jgi:hypothetical protein
VQRVAQQKRSIEIDDDGPSPGRLVALGKLAKPAHLAGDFGHQSISHRA